MAGSNRDVWITGVGLVSPLGEGSDAHGPAMDAQSARLNTSDWAPYPYHQLAPVVFDQQIPKKSDQRQMATCQRIGTYAAGLALQSAGLKGDAARLAQMDMVVTTLGGERDMSADAAVLKAMRGAADRAARLNETLMTELRPTFFLGQLPNLLAGNIAIVHGVTGSARVLLGEEEAGVDTLRIAAARIASGQSDSVLAGASYNGARMDILLYLVSAGHALAGEWRPVFERATNGGGIALGSAGAFLVLEAAEVARERGARPIARLTSVVSDAATPNDPAAREATLQQLWPQLGLRLDPERLAIISGASGAEPATSIERRFLERQCLENLALPIRATASRLGHIGQAQFPANVAIAALLVAQGRLCAPGGALEADVADDRPIGQIVVTGVGRNYGEALALVEAVGANP
jgi:3-oxoacyl-[acyl-carrier-protein] synthase II